MYVIRDKKSKAILHIADSSTEKSAKPEEIFPDFNPKTMEFGRSNEPAIPARFTIVNGEVKRLPPSESEAKPSAPTLAQAKAATLEHLSMRSLELRQKLIPDYQIQNAALGIYDQKKTTAIRNTVKAFRDEFHRLEAAVKKAKSAAELESLEENFPTKIETSKKESSE